MNESYHMRNMFPKLEDTAQREPARQDISIDHETSNFILGSGAALATLAVLTSGLLQYEMNKHPEQYRTSDATEQTRKENGFLSLLGFTGGAGLLIGNRYRGIETYEAYQRNRRNKR